MRRIGFSLPWLLLLGCNPPVPGGVGLIGDGLLNPFPSSLLIGEDGTLDIPMDALPRVAGGTPLPVDRFAGWRTGFSAGQTVVVRLPDVDPSALGAWRAPTPGDGGVRLYDRDTGAALPVMAELDAHPDAVGEPALLIRPLVALPDGHRVTVVIMATVAARPARFDAVVRGNPPADLAAEAENLQAILAELEALGVPTASVALAFDFPVDRGRVPLESALAAAPVAPSGSLDQVRTQTDGGRVAPLTWRAAQGSFTAADFLDGPDALRMGADGTVTAVGTREHPLYVHIPDRVRDAPAGTVPVVLFGHGLFAAPELYLDSDDDSHGVLAVMDTLGAIAIATRWEGLQSDERLDALGAAADFGRLPLVPDRAVDGNAAVRSLERLIVEGGLLDDPVFDGLSGQSLPRRGYLGYYGISVGGIEGAVQVGSGAPLDAAVLHAGGGQWSTMLERSTQWPAFELFVEEGIPDPADRQLLYAAAQLFWDPVDPIAWTDGLMDATVLWQESLGDEQVPNQTTRTLARSAGAEAFGPVVEAPWGLAPYAGGATVWTQYDPQVGIPADVNRPPDNSHAHSIPRTWPGEHAQVARFLDPDDPGVVENYCGGQPCTATNPGVAR